MPLLFTKRNSANGPSCAARIPYQKGIGGFVRPSLDRRSLRRPGRQDRRKSAPASHMASLVGKLIESGDARGRACWREKCKIREPDTRAHCQAFPIFAAAILTDRRRIAVVLLLLWSVTSIPDRGEVGVLTLFGRVTGETLGEGIHLINPLKSVQKLRCRRNR